MATTTQAAHQQPTRSAPRVETNPWIVLVVLTLGFFMILLDTTIVNIAIPSMEKGLNASFDQILWVLNAYTLVYAVLLITAGRMGDMFGPKRLFIIGLIVFTLASAACGFSQNAGELILFRCIQAVGGAILTPQTLAMLPSLFPPEKRGAAFGVWGAVSGLAAVIGPTLGGFLVTSFDWQSIFFVNLPVGVVAIVAAVVLMPEIRSNRRHKYDIPGMALASGGLFLLIYALIEGQTYKWGPISTFAQFSIGSTRWSLISIYSLIVYAVIILAAFLWYERRAEEPLLPLTLFHDRNFSVANGATMAIAFTMAGMFIPLTIFLQSVLDFSAVHAGLTLMPSSLALLVAAPLAGRLSDRINGKYIIMFGLTLATIGLALLVHALALSNTSWSLTFPLIVMGFGMGCTFAPMTATAMRDINPSMSGAASGVLTTTRQVAMAIGAAVVGAILANTVASDLPKQAARVAGQVPAKFRGQFLAGFRHAGSGAQNYGAGQTQGAKLPPGTSPTVAHQLSTLAHEVFAQAFLNGVRPALASSVAALALAVIVTSFMRGGRSAESARRSQPVGAAVPAE
jgi:EmrB/QacA subfamily drug resistance transporter